MTMHMIVNAAGRARLLELVPVEVDARKTASSEGRSSYKEGAEGAVTSYEGVVKGERE
jgi:hypothetical protein